MIFDYLLLTASVAVNVTGNSINNRFAKRDGETTADKFAYNLLASAAALAVVAIFGGSLRLSLTTFLLGMLFGVCNGCSFICRTFALAEGPMSLTLLIGSCGMLIPTVAGTIFWQEPISPLQIFGIALMLYALSLIMNVGTKPREGRLSFRWILFSAGSFLCTGFISVMQKVQQSSAYPDERGGFLLTSFAVALAINGLMLLASGRKATKRPSRQSAGGLLTGCCTGANHILNLYLSGVIPAVIFFPLVNGGGILLSALVGRLLFGEICSKRQYLGFVLGLAAILCISLG
jgi:drug/metabolite transporter (DMT)-like permease